MTGTILALAAANRTGTIRAQDGSRLVFCAAAVLGDYDTLAVGHRVSFDVEREHSYDTAVRVFREPLRPVGPGKKVDGPPDLRYAGFKQAGNVRSYRFDMIVDGRSVPQCVTVDVTLLLKHHVGVQEAPALCLHKLAQDLKAVPVLGHHELADGDLLAFASSRAVAMQRKKAKHSFTGRRGSPPPGPSGQVRES